MKFSPDANPEVEDSEEYFHRNMLFKKSKHDRLQRHKRLIERNRMRNAKSPDESKDNSKRYTNDNIHEYFDQ